MDLRRLILAALVTGAWTSPLAFAADKGDTYVYTGLVLPQYDLTLDSMPTAEASSIVWGAEPSLALAVGFSYKGLGLGTSFDLESKDQQDNTNERATKVETSYKSYDFSYYFSWVGFSVSYTELQGMKITEVDGAAATSLDPEGRDTYRPDIRLRSKSANLWFLPLRYNLNLDAFFDPAKLSEGSGIGLLFGGSYDDLNLAMKRPLVSEADARPFGIDANYMKGNFVTWSTLIGPVVTLDFHGLYASGLFALGNGLEKVDYEREQHKQESARGVSEKTVMYVATGYKGKALFATFDLQIEEPSYRLNSTIMSTTRGYAGFTIGARF